MYQEEDRVEPPKSSSAAAATDFQLLSLAADDLDVQHSGMGLAELLRPAGSCAPLMPSGRSCSCIPLLVCLLERVQFQLVASLGKDGAASSSTRLLVSIQAWVAVSVGPIAGLP